MITASMDEVALQRWGRALGAEAARAGVFVALEGPLGSGKTTLVRAACAGAGVSDPVTSPTFTLVHRYGAAPPIHHADLYRIAGPHQLRELGWDDLLTSESAVFVEWADRAQDALPEDRWHICLRIPPGGSCRTVEACALGDVPPLPGVP